MFCAYCGAQRPDDAAFCPSCGRAINAATNTSPLSVGLLPRPGVITAVGTGFFNVGTPKLILMCASTFNGYVLYWLYKNWVAERELSGDFIVPWARSLFAIIFTYSLAARVRDRLLTKELAPTVEPTLITIGFIVLVFSQNLPDPLWLLTLLVGCVLVPLQNEMARVNESLGVAFGPEAKFNTINIVWLTVAAMLWPLVLIGLFVPEAQ
jgi:hypothetical protein